MIAKTARFEVRPDRLDECLAAIVTFTAAVREREPETLLYLALQDADQPSRFVHVMAFANEDAEAAHRETPWVQAFVESLYPHTLEGVTFRDHSVVAGL